jgi:uncharacterized repeat protein (TIGR01451 family)
VAIALASGSLADGPPRTIAFVATNSVDPDGDTLTYDWDLDGDGNFGDASGDTATRDYTTSGSFRVAVRVTDTSGASDVQSMLVTVATALADVGVTLDDGVDAVAPGDSIVYTMIVTNHGTNAVPGESVATTLSGKLTDVAWTCAASIGGACAASGSGDIDDAADLAASGTATYTVHATVAAGATGSLESSASVTAPSGYEDPNATDDSATDIDTIAITDRIFADGFDPP